MGSKTMMLLFVAVTVCMVAGTQAASGNFTNCGKVPFNITWSPEPISPSRALRVIAEYVFPHEFSEGTYDVTVWFHGDDLPFLEFADSFTCGDILEYVRIPCPIKQNFMVKINKLFEHIPNIGSYPGNYDVKLSVKNEKGKEMICLKGHVIILKN